MWQDAARQVFLLVDVGRSSPMLPQGVGKTMADRSFCVSWPLLEPLPRPVTRRSSFGSRRFLTEPQEAHRWRRRAGSRRGIGIFGIQRDGAASLPLHRMLCQNWLFGLRCIRARDSRAPLFIFILYSYTYFHARARRFRRLAVKRAGAACRRFAPSASIRHPLPFLPPPFRRADNIGVNAAGCSGPQPR
jgi:hypothetical protein